MSMSLTAKTILVTGANRGLGLEFVKQILQMKTSPAVLIAGCRDPNSAEDLQALAKSNSSLKVIKLDIEKDDDIISAFNETKTILGDRGLNLLINNAGLNTKNVGSDLRQSSRDNLQQHFNVNVSGPIIMVQRFLPLLEQAAGLQSSSPLSCSKAAVVNISSIMASQELALQDGKGTSFQYKCSKSAVTMATILMSRELGPIGIAAFSLHPGWVQTDMGGAQAPLTPEQSIAGCLKVIAAHGEANNGKLMDYKGDILPF